MVAGMAQDDALTLRWIFVLQRHQVDDSFLATVINAPDALATWIGNLGGCLGDLDRRVPLAVLLDGHQLVDTAQRRLSPRCDQARAHAVDEPFDEVIWVHTI